MRVFPSSLSLSLFPILPFALAGTVIALALEQELLTSTEKNAATIPPVGLGLWNAKGNDATHAVEYAFQAGYVHFDSAAAYVNEEYVGTGLHSKAALTNRSEYWVTSKLWNNMHEPEKVAVALKKTLSELQLDYLDLYLMHWPVAFRPDTGDRDIVDDNLKITDTWKGMEATVKEYEKTGKGAKHIGVSNFSPRQLDQILSMCKICPYAHEFETHPYLQQQSFVDWHEEHGIKVIAYSPLANLNPTYKSRYPSTPSILKDPFWQSLAKNKNVTVPQAVLGWGVQRGTAVIPKSTHEDRIIENLKGGTSVTFTKEEIVEIAQQDKRLRFNDPSGDWGVELFEGLDDGTNRFFAGTVDL